MSTDGRPWCEAEAHDVSGRAIGTGWVNSDALRPIFSEAWKTSLQRAAGRNSQ